MQLVDQSIRSRDKAASVGALATIAELLIVFAPLYLALLLNEAIGTDHTNLVGDVVLISGPLPIAGMVATVVLFWLAMRRRGETLADFGLGPVDSWPRTIALALGISLIIFVVVAFILNPVISGLDLAPRDMSRFEPLEGNIANLIINIAMMWITAAFLEELLWRGYLISRLGGLFRRESLLRWAFVLVVSAMFFALPHFTQGAEGMIKTGAIGLLFGVAFLAIGRRLWPLVLSHGLIDTLDFISHYVNG